MMRVPVKYLFIVPAFLAALLAFSRESLSSLL